MIDPGVVTIVHVRDPDSSCSVRVFIDAVEQDWQEIEVVDIDAGCGYTAEDWHANVAWAEAMPPSPLRDALMEAYGDPPGSEYIDGWHERQEEGA